MRIANLAGRSTIVSDEGLIDVAEASQGAFSASIDKCLAQLALLESWWLDARPTPTTTITPEAFCADPRLGPVVERPSQVFAVGLNYRRHAEETHMALPQEPMIFTKFASSLCGPNESVTIPSSTTDYEAELVVVIGHDARDVNVDDALSIVAGYCVGQDFSERDLQRRGSPAQFSLAKSYRHFAPIGPWLTTASDVANPNDLRISCEVSGVRYQDSSTSDMVFTVAELLSYLSGVVELRRGDLIFTGTPNGVGQAQDPRRFLRAGDLVVTEISSLGRIANDVIGR